MCADIATAASLAEMVASMEPYSRLDLPRQQTRAQQSGIESVLDVKVGLRY